MDDTAAVHKLIWERYTDCWKRHKKQYSDVHKKWLVYHSIPATSLSIFPNAFCTAILFQNVESAKIKNPWKFAIRYSARFHENEIVQNIFKYGVHVLREILSMFMYVYLFISTGLLLAQRLCMRYTYVTCIINWIVMNHDIKNHCWYGVYSLLMSSFYSLLTAVLH